MKMSGRIGGRRRARQSDDDSSRQNMNDSSFLMRYVRGDFMLEHEQSSSFSRKMELGELSSAPSSARGQTNSHSQSHQTGASSTYSAATPPVEDEEDGNMSSSFLQSVSCRVVQGSKSSLSKDSGSFKLPDINPEEPFKVVAEEGSTDTIRTRSLDEDDHAIGGTYRVKTSRRSTVLEKTKNLALEALNFDRLGLIGREEETKLLRSAFDDLMLKKKTCVWVSGEGGTGKTVLVSQLQRLCQDNSDQAVFYIYGKCDQQEIDEPLGAIKAAMESLCYQICTLPRKDADTPASPQCVFFEDIQKKIQEELRLEHHVLLNVIPALDDIFNTTNDEPRTKNNSGASLKESGEQIKYALCRFMKVITDICPLIYVCDDLQWADAPTRDLLSSWICDHDISRFLFCGLFRSNAIQSDANDDLSRLLSKVEASNNGSFKILRLEMSNFSNVQLSKLVAELLPSGDHRKSNGLCAIILSRTNGNPFFVTQFILSLVNQRLLSYNIGRLCWEWNEEEGTIIYDTIP